MKNHRKFLLNLLEFIRFSNIKLILKGAIIMLLLFLTLGIGFNAYALELQQVTITGTITDQKGVPLPGVSVVVKGTTLGTLTNATGKYGLTKVANNATLIFSFIGMTSQEI